MGIVWDWIHRPRARMGLGLRLGSTQVSVVELKRDPDGAVRVLGEGACDLPSGAMEAGQIRRQTEVVQAIHGLLIRCGVTCPRVTLDLPARSVLLRNLQMPEQAHPRRWHEAARREAAALLQVDPSDLAVDCVAARPSSHGADAGHRHRAITVAAVRHDRVRERLAIAQALGLEAVAMEPDHHAAQRTLARWLEGLRAGVAPCPRLPVLAEIDRRTVRLTMPGGPEGIIERELGSHGPQATDLMQAIEHLQAAWPSWRPDAVVVAGWVPTLSWREELTRRCGRPVHLMDSMGGLHRGATEDATVDATLIALADGSSNGRLDVASDGRVDGHADGRVDGHVDGHAEPGPWRHGFVACGLALRSLAC